MKKILLLLLCLIPLFAFSQLKQGVGFEYYQLNEIVLVNPDAGERIYFEKGDYAVLYKMEFTKKNFTIESLASLYMDKTEGDWTFSPTHADFTAGISYKINKIKLKIEHSCYHPMLTETNKYNVRMYGAQTKIGIYYNFD